MSELLSRLTENLLCLTRQQDDLLATSRRLYEEAAAIEATYVRYETPTYLRRHARSLRAGRPG